MAELKESDARALWAVRVLDAWSKWRGYQWTINTSRPTTECQLHMPSVRFFDGPSPDAAREAAALAVWPELPESVRAEIGERP
jgi:hypothetical protein